VGSFLNVVIFRLKTKETILKSRSHCVFCKKKLSWYELIPLLSFTIQKGRCRECHKKISWQYPIIEIITGLLFLSALIYSAPGGSALGWQFPYIIYGLFLWLIFSFLIIIFVYDLKHYSIPNIIVLPAIVLSLFFDIYLWLSTGQFFIFLSSIIAMIIAGGFFLILVLISKEKWMGMGDVFMGMLMGLILGTPQIFVALFFAFLIGAIISIILLILKKKKMKSEIPFGPFLVLGTIIALLYGNVLLGWYLNLI